MLWFICFFNYADRLAIFSVFPVIEKQYHFSKTDLGLIGAAFTWVYALASPFAGHIGDRYPRKWVILGGLFVWSLITGLTAQCRLLWQFVLVRGSEGLGEAFYFPASMAIISDYHTPATRSRAIGLHQTSIFAGTIGGGALAGWMGQHYGWQSPFRLLAVAGIGLGILLRVFIREPKRNQAEREERGAILENTEPEPISMRAFLVELARTPTAILLVAAYFGANMVGLVFLTWMPTFLKEKFGLNLAAAGLGATFFIQMASIAGSLVGGVLADLLVLTRLDGRIRLQALAALLGAPFIFLCGYTRSPAVLVVAMTLFGLCKGVYDSNLTAAYYDVITPIRRGTATGLMNLVGWMGAGLGSLAIGVAVDHHITMSAAISSTALIYIGVAAILYSAAVFTAQKDIRTVRGL
jgi:MFS family permease